MKRAKTAETILDENAGKEFEQLPSTHPKKK